MSNVSCLGKIKRLSHLKQLLSAAGTGLYSGNY